ncbi:MAG: hypothetical protein ABFD54_07865 [Armatimonadota bacterium]|nr:hypothetical protein [bacterium]
MERLYRDKSSVRKPGGGLKDQPLCEHCGKPVKITSEDYLRDEILCASCAAEAKESLYDDYDSPGTA